MAVREPGQVKKRRHQQGRGLQAHHGGDSAAPPWRGLWTFLMDGHAPSLAPVPRAVVSHQASDVYHAELTSAGFGCT
jgi:hypothetical protein